MRLLLCESITGGALAGQPLPAGLAAEAEAMLAALLSDCLTLVGWTVAIVRDARLPIPEPAPHRIGWVTPGQFRATFHGLLDWAEAAWVVAPEPELAALTRAVEARGRLLLGCTSAGVDNAADKWDCGRRLAAAGLPVPPVRLARHDDDLPPPGWTYPLVLKPRRGCGCQGATVAAGPQDLPGALRRLDRAGSTDDFLVQPYAAGQPASVSVLVAPGGGAVPLCLNRQHIAIGPGGELAYRGGETPLDHPLGARALYLGAAAAGAIPGLQGYVGVDLVLGDRQVWIVEVNPRVTTSYVGLRQVSPFNLPGAVLAALCHEELPPSPSLTGHVTFGPFGGTPVRRKGVAARW